MSGIPAWLAKWRVTGTWAAHIRRGSAGGVDFGAPAGTDILSPSAGVVSFRYFPDDSSVIRVTRPDGTATEFLHGHKVGRFPRVVRSGDHIGESDGRPGRDGAGPSNGAHIHVHDVTAAGSRVYPFSTIASSPAGGGASPIDTDEEDEDMKTAQMHFTDGTLTRRIAFTPGTAWYLEWTEGGSAIANALASAVDTGNSIPGTKSMRDAVVASAERVRSTGVQ